MTEKPKRPRVWLVREPDYETFSIFCGEEEPWWLPDEGLWLGRFSEWSAIGIPMRVVEALGLPVDIYEAVDITGWAKRPGGGDG